MLEAERKNKADPTSKLWSCRTKSFSGSTKHKVSQSSQTSNRHEGWVGSTRVMLWLCEDNTNDGEFDKFDETVPPLETEVRKTILALIFIVI